jgi:molybdopterin converting factor small subunit
MKVLYFGVLGELTGKRVELSRSSKSLAHLKMDIYNSFPDFLEHPHIIAVNHEVVHGDIALSEGDEVAFLPPYSGG